MKCVGVGQAPFYPPPFMWLAVWKCHSTHKVFISSRTRQQKYKPHYSSLLGQKIARLQGVPQYKSDNQQQTTWTIRVDGDKKKISRRYVVFLFWMSMTFAKERKSNTFIVSLSLTSEISIATQTAKWFSEPDNLQLHIYTYTASFFWSP